MPLEKAEDGTDRWAVENGFVSITPLRLDLTDEAELKKHSVSLHFKTGHYFMDSTSFTVCYISIRCGLSLPVTYWHPCFL